MNLEQDRLYNAYTLNDMTVERVVNKKEVDKCRWGCLFIILTIVTSSLLLNLVVYFWLLPKQVTKFSDSISNFTYEINKIQKYENEIDDINVKFNNIYSTIENLCKLDILKKYCTNITNTCISLACCNVVPYYTYIP